MSDAESLTKTILIGLTSLGCDLHTLLRRLSITTCPHFFNGGAYVRITVDDDPWRIVEVIQWDAPKHHKWSVKRHEFDTVSGADYTSLEDALGVAVAYTRQHLIDGLCS